MKESFVVRSKFDDLPIHGFLIEPQGEPKAIVQLVHGMAERKERYEEFANYLAEKGYAVVCHDHRGHGESILSDKDRGWFGDYSGKAVVEDTVLVTEYAKKRFEGLPLILFGHSMGSLVVRCYLQEYDRLCDKLIVCGSPSKNPLVGVAIGLEKCIRFFRGARYRSKLLKHLSTGKGNKPFEKEGKEAWLSRNRESVERYIADPKCGFRFTCNGYENLFKLLRSTYTKKAYRVQNPMLPVHFIAGGDDPVIVNEKKWRSAADFLRRVGYASVTAKLYPNMRHELLNELGREEVYADILKFIEKA